MATLNQLVQAGKSAGLSMHDMIGIGLSAQNKGITAKSIGSSANSSPVNVAPAIDQLSGVFDQIGAQSAQNSARSADAAREANQFAAQQGAIARDFNAAEAAKNRDWQEYMSNTAHQREVADLRAAGLNPVLSAMGGNGAAVTSGAAANAALPASSMAQTDMTQNASIVQLLSSFIGAQTQMLNTAVSAKTAEAVADKYTAMSKLVAEMNNATSRYGIDVSSWTSLTNTEKSVAASRYAAELQSAASRFGAELSASNAYKIAMAQLEWQSEHPSNMWQGLGDLIKGLTGGSPGEAASGFFDFFKDYDKSDTRGKNSRVDNDSYINALRG